MKKIVDNPIHKFCASRPQTSAEKRAGLSAARPETALQALRKSLYSAAEQVEGAQNRARHRSRSMPGMAWRLLALCAILCGIVLLTPGVPVAHADGGAPNLAYVAGSAQGVSVIDIAQQKVTSTLALAGDPTMLYLTLDGRYLYAAQPALNEVSMLDTSNGQLVCRVSVPGQPSLLAFDAGVNLLYAAGNGTAGITALNAGTCTINKVIATNGPVYGLATAEVGSGPNGGTGNQLWFTTHNSLNVYTIQPDKIRSIVVPGDPQYISIPPGVTVYVTTRQGTVVAVSLQDLQAAPPLLKGGDFGPMDFDAFTGEVYVPDKKHRLVDVLTPIYFSGSTIPHEPNHVIKLDAAPQSVAITGDGNLGFFALAGGTVVMFDIPGQALSMTFSVGGAPRFIITGLYPPIIRNSQQNNANGSPIPTNLLLWLAASALLFILALAFLLILARRKRN
ncbi:MAG TPA: hypothetical protein VGD98_25050 [Ktedonobacteraceae bacterium]